MTTRLIARLRARSANPNGLNALMDDAANEIERLALDNKRLRLFLGEISVMNSEATEEWDANTLEHAVSLAKQALGPHEQKAPAVDGNVIYCERCEENFVPQNRDYQCPRCRR